MFLNKADLAHQSIATIQELFQEGSFGPQELLDSLLQNIHSHETEVHAYLFLQKEEILRAEAERAQHTLRKQQQGGTMGGLTGIPLAVKDNTYVAAMPCTGGSRLLGDFVPKQNAFVVERLRKSGAIIMGKSNLDEMGAFGIATNNPHYGRTRNPWNLERVPGGSSGGSAAAVASGEALAATGSDTGGSVRIPACFCGLVGMKPTFGRLGRTGVLGMSWSIDHLGVIARSVRDAALLTCIMAGEDPQDAATHFAPPLPHSLLQGEQELRGLKVGILGNPIREASAGVTANFQRSVEKLAELGATLVPVLLPRMEEVTPAIFAIALAETAAYHEDWLRATPELYGSVLKSYVQLGHGILATQYLKAQRLKTEITGEAIRALGKVDAMILPTAPAIAPALNQEKVTIKEKEYPAFQVLTENTYPINFFGLPAISIPNGFSENMPTGLQICSTPWREEVLFRIGAAYQQLTDYHLQVPRMN